MDLISNAENSTSLFEQLKQVDEDGTEYWLATDLLTAMGYKAWKRIKDTVERAKVSAFNSGLDVSCHFDNVVQMAQIGDSQAFREVLKDYKLSRHACYITAMNGDPRKPEIAAAQSYFAVKTREAELASQYQEILQTVLSQIDRQNQAITSLSFANAKQGEDIAQLQAQVQNLLPPSANFIPPGWDADVWEKLPPQDKRHFRFLHRRRQFRPDNHSDAENPLVIADQVKQEQKDELNTVIGQVSPEEKERLETAKQEALKLLEDESA
jgi:DNA-damage-inducible protein D